MKKLVITTIVDDEKEIDRWINSGRLPENEIQTLLVEGKITFHRTQGSTTTYEIKEKES